MTHGESTHRDKIPSRFCGVEYRLPDVDFGGFIIGINALELSQDRCVLVIHLGKPEPLAIGGSQDLITGSCLGQPFAVEINRTRVMAAFFCIEPAAGDKIRIRIEFAKQAVGHRNLPRVAPDLFPARHDFGALDRHLLAGGCLIDDALRLRFPATRRVDPLAINSLMHGDHIAGLGGIGRTLDGQQR